MSAAAHSCASSFHQNQQKNISPFLFLLIVLLFSMKIQRVSSFFFITILTLMFFSIDVALVSGKCQSNEQSLLLELKKSLVFNESMSTKLVTWNLSMDCCEWEGVNCDVGGLGHVIGLDLSNESISGGLDNASDLFKLQFLQRLNLSYNNFDATLPARFANLTDLNYLDLSNAGFVGQIPIEISNLTKLVSLDLSAFYGGAATLKLENPNLAMLVRNLTRLTELSLDGVNISAHGNEWCQVLVSSLPDLQMLSLRKCFLSGPLDPSLGKLQSLSVLHLDGNNLSALIPEFFANFSKLTALRLSFCELSGIFPSNIFHLPMLKILDLSNNRLLGGSLPEFSQNLSLQTLVISYTNFSGTLPQAVDNLTQLAYLDLSLNNFKGPIPSFRISRNLSYMDLSHNQLTGEISSIHWEGLPNLAYVDFRNNSLTGRIPSSLFAIATLQNIQLGFNRFGGEVPEFSNGSSSSLNTLDLSRNKLEGSIPISFFGLGRLNVLLLSFNKFNGTIQLDWIKKLANITHLDLSYNNLTVGIARSNSTSTSFPQIRTLGLASCNLRMFPDLSDQSHVFHLDLSNNQITGLVPRWIWRISDGYVDRYFSYLNLSHNLLVGLEEPFSFPIIYTLDLHQNRLQGNIPILPLVILYVDFSSNNLSSSIPPNIGNHLYQTFFFSFSNNRLTGAIPHSICHAGYLNILDLSNNNLNGTIPACIIEKSETLGVLDLRRNNFVGNIPDEFPSICGLKTLDLSGNHLAGQVPKSLTSCTKLEVLDMSHNQINDSFPCFLKNVSTLRVLALSKNRFHGHIGCLQNVTTWPRLQIVDLASNYFSGRLPLMCSNTWEAMIRDGNQEENHLRYLPLMFTEGVYYQDSVRVTIKGLDMELVKILTIFTSIDLSCNNFEGPIPEMLGQFKALHGLNLSHNALTGRIPSSFGNLSQLESLDLSVNHLTGTIPHPLAGITFLSFLNLSNNRLVGGIPTGSQLQTFSPDSFKDNEGLCGLPLNDNCSHESPQTVISQSKSGIQADWNFISIELGFVFGLGIIILPLMFYKRYRIWYFKHVDRVVLRIFPELDETSMNHGRRAQRNRRRRQRR